MMWGWLGLMVGTAAAAPVELARHGGANAQRPVFSASGDEIVYEANNHEDKTVVTYIGPIATAGPFTPVHGAQSASGLTSGFSTRSSAPAVVHEVSWSPARMNAYVYASSANGQDYDLFFKGGRAAVVGPQADGGPAWSPDGRSIVFTSARSGEGDLYVMDLAQLQAPPRRLTSRDSSSEVYAEWSPDSQRVTYVAHSPTGDNLWMVAVETGVEVQLTHWPRIQTRPRFSPDGTWLAFYANHEDADRFDLYVMRPQHIAGPQLVLRDVLPNATGPTWTPDGGHLIAVLDDDDLFDPIVAINPLAPSNTAILDLGTAGNTDLDVALGSDGVLRIAWTAKGLMSDSDRSFRRLFLAELPALP